MSSISTGARLLLPDRDLRWLLLKWIVALVVPLSVFTFVWSGEEIVNNVLLGIFLPQSTQFTTSTVIQAGIFILLFYATVMALIGYLVAADTGYRGIVELWIDVLVFVIVPLLLIIITNNLLIGLALCAIIWPLYFLLRKYVRKLRHYVPPLPLESLQVIDAEKRALLMSKAAIGGFWFGMTFSVISLIADIVFYISDPNSFPLVLLAWVVVRTLLLPVAGYFLGRLGGIVALRRTLNAKAEENGVAKKTNGRVSKRRQLQSLSASRAKEEAKDLVPNDLPLRSTGAQRFYLTILVAFVLFYPVLDPILFGSGTNGRLSGYGDAGFYVILALGLNIVVGFAGLLDLGYVAFFAIGSYAWGLVGSTQFTVVTRIVVNPQIWPWFFWPMIIVAALIAAFWAVVFGVPTLRLRGDYLAIVTLGFGEIIPIFFLELDKYTNGTNGIVGVYSPYFPGIDWHSYTPIPYYYLILALIALSIFANVRLRDSRLGRAWVAIREDEIAASSSGINLANTKLLAFGAGAFFSGVAGVYHAAKLGTVSPDNFNSADSIIYLAMVVIGGLGSIPGVIVGALAVYSINLFVLAQLDTIASDPNNILHTVQQLIPGFTFGSIRNLIFGIILVAVMIFRPEGLIPSARRRRELHRAEGEAAEVGSLDAPPGSAVFESEVRVE
ncbi:MAG TPA: branched-chain amino acid ABC transporter permease [Ktedonosporobacter sp.]|nr:branched-chain amino acid ABC transporter permease [Ktedonosporobacter sp.]